VNPKDHKPVRKEKCHIGKKGAGGLKGKGKGEAKNQVSSRRGRKGRAALKKSRQGTDACCQW